MSSPKPFLIMLIVMGVLVLFSVITRFSLHTHHPVPDQVLIKNPLSSPAKGVPSQDQKIAVLEASPALKPISRTGIKPADRDPPDALPNEKVLRFKDHKSMQDFLAWAGENRIRVISTIDSLRALRVSYQTPEELASLIKQAKDAEIDFNYLVQTPDIPEKINSPRDKPYLAFGNQTLEWLGITGDNQSFGKGITVAILDTGVMDHPALSGVQIKKQNLVTDPAGESPVYSTHATAVASILSGTTPAAPGVAPSANLLSIQVLNAEGVGNSFTVAQGIDSAMSQGARVINLSLGSYGDNALLREAVSRAQTQGIILVAAAGNEGFDQLPFPARYPGVISVTAVDANRERFAHANAANGVTFAAPGVGLSAAGKDGLISLFSGTSAATPVISGIIAAGLSQDPSLRPSDIKELLISHSNDLGAPGPDEYFGNGIPDYKRIINRNTTGINDPAIADIFLPPTGNSPSGQTKALITIQNRGTSVMYSSTIDIDINGVSRHYAVPVLNPNQSFAQEIPIPTPGASSSTRIQATLSSGLPDSNRSNNQFVWSIQPKK